MRRNRNEGTHAQRGAHTKFRHLLPRILLLLRLIAPCVDASGHDDDESTSSSSSVVAVVVVVIEDTRKVEEEEEEEEEEEDDEVGLEGRVE